MGHTGGRSQRDEIVAFWCPEPAGEADPGAFPGRMTVAPPPLEVSTQAKLVFPVAPLVGSPGRGGGLLPRGSSRWRGALGSRPLCNRGPCRRVPLSRHSGWEPSLAGRFHASPPLEFSGETPSSHRLYRHEDTGRVLTIACRGTRRIFCRGELHNLRRSLAKLLAREPEPQWEALWTLQE
jgi:hypothetical protein